jgi:hypothetical protein
MAPVSSTLRAVLGGLAFSTPLIAPRVTAIAPATASTDNSNGSFIAMSKVNATIFGQDAATYDYFLLSNATPALDALGTLRQAIAQADTDSIALAFLNVTMAGTIPQAHASDMGWVCAELDPKMTSHVPGCRASGSSQHLAREPLESGLMRRSYYLWKESSNHVSSQYAMQALIVALNEDQTAVFPVSPRSFCNTIDSKTACISWSKDQTAFTHASATSFVSDGMSAVDLSAYSAQANGVLGPNEADVCLSDRPNGCT